MSFEALAARFWHPVARAVDVAPGQVVKVTLLDRDLALWRDHAGTAHVVDDLCSHRGARLSAGDVADDGCIRCPYHAWRFDPAGTCTQIPQLGTSRPIPRQADVPAFRVSEHAGLVWTCLVDEADELRPRPTWEVTEAGTHWLHIGETYDWDAQVFRQVENFCDVAHFSTLHVDTFGNPALQEMDAIHVDVSDDGWHLRFDYPYASFNPVDGSGPFDMVFEYHVELPFTVDLAGASGPGSVMCIAPSPMSGNRTRLFWLCAFPLGTDVDGDEYEEIERRIWEPDRAIVGGQRPDRLPVDLLEELHLPFDRLAVAYRRGLAALGFNVPAGRRTDGTPAPGWRG
ncbi:MAG: Rieske (2Fe-2S) iron-sulfur domain protein [Actinomycetia bacterium]|nr:Rieske (2Fe-2S) iron-sulfur domain protein [Actinomycetes bacterium]